MKRATYKRALFWAGVAGVSLLAPFGLALIAAKSSSPGLKQFRTFVYGANS